jgi:AraC-like DNA-binding protein
MDLGQLDLATRMAGITVLLLLAGLLWRDRVRVGLPAVLFAPLALCLSGFLIGNAPSPALIGAAATLAHFASGFTVVALWWFCLACFDPRFRPGGAVLAVGLLWISLALADRLDVLLPDAIAGNALIVLGFGITAHLAWRLWSEREGDLIATRQRARSAVIAGMAGLLLADLSVDLLFGNHWRPLAFTLAQNGALLLALGLTRWLLVVRVDAMLFDAGPPLPADASPAADPLHRRLVALIEQEQLHLDPDLSFADFVRCMNAPERLVRRLINQELGFDHFRAFLNHHRVATARLLLADPARADEKLISIAFDCGFGSLASFNRVFRAVEGCTPGAYRQRIATPVPAFAQRFAGF